MASCVCIACAAGQVETVSHFVSGCTAYGRHRDEINRHVTTLLTTSNISVSTEQYNAMTQLDRTSLLRGKHTGDAVVEAQIDRAVKKFLIKAWNARAGVTTVINTELGKRKRTHLLNLCTLSLWVQ